MSMDAHRPAPPRTPTPVISPGRIRFRPEAFTPEALAGYGWPDRAALARDLGVYPSTLYRAMDGEGPGEKLIAALLQVTGQPFDHLFYTDPGPARPPR